MRDSSRLGYTLLELFIVLAMAAVVMAVAIPRLATSIDRVSVRSATADVTTTLGAARTMAMAIRAGVAVDVDTTSGVLRVRRGAEMLFSRNIGHAHGVTLGASRDSLAFGPRGLGRGAANLSIVIRRGAAVETVFVSRLGRVR